MPFSCCLFLQLGSTFFRRLAWSPCGHFITTTHGFQKPRHSAPVLERGEWAATFDFLGHNAPIVVVKFNNSTFRKNFSNDQDPKAAPVGWANGASKTPTKEQQPYNVIAIGSQDRTITVWTTASARPLFVARHFFSQSVVDLSWYEMSIISLQPLLTCMLKLMLILFVSLAGALMVIHFLPAPWMDQLQTFTLK
jgi:hypothetical protein